VRSLILGCTASGGPHAVQAEPEAIGVLMARDMTPEQATEAILPFIYDPGTPRKRIDEDMAIRMKWYPTAEGYLAQLQGILMWEAYSRIAQIAAPTLVIHGETDRLVPPANGKLIASRISGTKLATIPNASHIFATDQEQASHRAILEFLAAQNGAKEAPTVSHEPKTF
jgi:3-oxoadipate enol-lactonase